MVGEAHGCDPGILKNVDYLATIVREGAAKAGATIVGELVKKYDEGEGVSIVLVVKESHVSLHTWPEYGYASIDVYTCGESTDPVAAFDHVISFLSPKLVTSIEIKRGMAVNHKILERERILVNR